MTDSRIALDDFNALMEEKLPMAAWLGIRAESIGQGVATMRLAFKPELTRPGGTIAGPALMALADACMYAVVLGAVGREELALTTNLNVNFLRRPPAADVLAEGRVLKLGKRLAVSEVEMYAADDRELVCHVTGTYSIPPQG